MTIQAAHGQILVDVLDEIHVCAQSWHSFDDLHLHLLLMMDFDCPLAFHHKKGEYIFELVEFLFSRGELFWLVGACGV